MWKGGEPGSKALDVQDGTPNNLEMLRWTLGVNEVKRYED
jgi:hypothetical protein